MMEIALTASDASTPKYSYIAKVSECFIWCQSLACQDRPLRICQPLLQHCDIKITISCIEE